MTRRRHWLALLGTLALAAVPGRRLAAQSISLFVSGLSADSTSPAPLMTLTAVGLPFSRGPYTVTLELSLEPQFRAPFYVDASDQPNPSFHLDSLLPEQRMVYFRARAIDALGIVVAQDLAQHPVRSWLRLVDPARSTGTPLTTRTPRFVWSSPAITVPPGLWIYDVAVINSATGQIDLSASGIQDTSFVFPDSLQSNTSYRWQVHARAQNGPPTDQVTVTSAATFVITSADQPTFTLFYQNFPNPFGRGGNSAQTCFWFDLAHASRVSLVIYDIRLREVRTIVPGPIGGGQLSVGAYGRQNVSAQTGCDDRLSWDGRDDTGRYVPPGVYLAVFKGDGVLTSKKILYKGP